MFARRAGGDETRYRDAVAANTATAYQEYLAACQGCAHRADAQAALDKLQHARAVTDLEDRFKDLLGKQQLAPPAQPNATDALHQLQTGAPDDPYIPQARSELAAALKAVQPPVATAPAKHATRPAAAVKKMTPPRKLAKTAAKPDTRPAAKTTKANAPVPAVATNEVMPKPIAAPAPQYPQAGKGQRGYVVLEFMVNVDGSTSNMKVIESSPPGVFDDAAMHAVHGWLFSPDTVDGVRQRKLIQWRFDFKP
jgi:TonB family protein